jgi:hypothetical protein
MLSRKIILRMWWTAWICGNNFVYCGYVRAGSYTYITENQKDDTLSVKINENKSIKTWLVLNNFVPLLYEREIDSPSDCVPYDYRTPLPYACESDWGWVSPPFWNEF